MKAKLVRKPTLNHIEIKIGKETYDLWEGIIGHCSKDLSDDELRMVYDQCNKQLEKMKSADVPLVFRRMMAELNQVIISRHCFVDEKGGGAK